MSSNIPIHTEKVQTAPLPEIPRPKKLILWSTFTIVLNTNKKPDGNYGLQLGVTRLNAAAKETFDSHEDMEKIVQFRDPTHSFSTRYIKSIDNKYATEMGRTLKGNRLHIHVVCQIRHVSNIQLSAPMIKELMNQKLPPEYQIHYVSIRFTPDAGAIREYIEKESLD